MSRRSNPFLTRSSLRALAAACGAGVLASMSVGSQAAFAASEDDVDVVNTETVQVYQSADGAVESQRVYEQIVLTGEGRVDLTNPVSTDGLRNLDGFSGFDVEDGAQSGSFDVDGVERLRSVSDFDGELPIEVDVAYTLDGESVKPGDVVGKDGELEVEFTVTNVSGEQREVTVADGRGGTITRTVDVPMPLAGSLTTIAPANFTNVRSAQFNRAGDGQGGTKLVMSMTLIPPIGPVSHTFGYTADIEDGVVPRVEVSALPIDPIASPTYKGGAESYQAGAESGTAIAEGATEIDTNLLKLRDGAADLLAGLVKLHDGAQELSDGLTGKAAPGAKDLADGAGQLAAGTGDARTGSEDLRDGLGLISDGLGRLADAEGLPKAADGVDQLKVGVDKILAGFGSVGAGNTLIDGLNQLEVGLGQLSAGLVQLRGDGSPQTPGLVGAKGGVDQVQAGLNEAIKNGGSIDTLLGGLSLLKTLDCGPICQTVIDTQLIPGVQDSKANLTAANGGLLQVSAGLGDAIAGLNAQLIPGANAAATGAGDAKVGAQQLKGGIQQVRQGLSDLDAGLTEAVSGVLRLSSGASDAYAGSGELADGLGQLDDGAGQVAAGADELSAGLSDAADGSGQLADGLGQARAGAPQLVEGASELSEKGTRKMARKGAKTAQDYGTRYAVLEAQSERAHSESMAYGAPEGATGLTAYSIILKSEDGEGARNWTRALTGLGLLAAGGGVLLLRRRLL